MTDNQMSIRLSETILLETILLLYLPLERVINMPAKVEIKIYNPYWSLV